MVQTKLYVCLIFICFFYIFPYAWTQQRTRQYAFSIPTQNSKLLEKVLRKYPEYFEEILKHPDRYRVQIIFTQINRDKRNRAYVKHHTFNLDTTLFFYPASMVKLPVAALALEKVNELQKVGYSIDEYTPMKTIPVQSCEKARFLDPSSPTGYAHIAHYIKKIFLVSDNEAYDRLFEFVTPCEINRKLHQKGYKSVAIVNRYYQKCGVKGDRITPIIQFVRDGEVIYEQASTFCDTPFVHHAREAIVGKAHRNSQGRIVPGGFNFTYANFISLADLHKILMALMIPSLVPDSQRFHLYPWQYRMLHKFMSMYPFESRYPNYQDRHPSLVKYLLYGGSGNTSRYVDTTIRIFNKVGMSFGFLTDCAYIIDFKYNVEFFLSATIFVDRGGVLNDGMYDYYSEGFPFFRNLGQVLLELERHRRKPRKPDFTFYKHHYWNDEEVFSRENYLQWLRSLKGRIGKYGERNSPDEKSR